MKYRIRKQNKYKVNIQLLRERNQEILLWQEINYTCNQVMQSMFGNSFLSGYLTWFPTDMYAEIGLYEALQQIPYYINKRRMGIK